MRMSRISKISAWVLMACFMLYVISGFDMQRRMFMPEISSLIHLKYLYIPAQLAFMLHSSYAVYVAMKRRKFWNLIGKGILTVYVTINIALLSFFISIYL